MRLASRSGIWTCPLDWILEKAWDHPIRVGLASKEGIWTGPLWWLLDRALGLAHQTGFWRRCWDQPISVGLAFREIIGSIPLQCVWNLEWAFRICPLDSLISTSYRNQKLHLYKHKSVKSLFIKRV